MPAYHQTHIHVGPTIYNPFFAFLLSFSFVHSFLSFSHVSCFYFFIFGLNALSLSLFLSFTRTEASGHGVSTKKTPIATFYSVVLVVALAAAAASASAADPTNSLVLFVSSMLSFRLYIDTIHTFLC